MSNIDPRTGQVHPMGSSQPGGINVQVSDTGRIDPGHRLRALMSTNPSLNNDPEVLNVLNKWYGMYSAGNSVDPSDVMSEIIGTLMRRQGGVQPAPWRTPNQVQGYTQPQQYSQPQYSPQQPYVQTYDPMTNSGQLHLSHPQTAPLPNGHPEAEYDPLLFNDLGQIQTLPQGMTYKTTHSKTKVKLALQILLNVQGTDDPMEYYSAVQDLAENMGGEGLDAFKEFKCNQRKDGKLPKASVLYQEALDIVSECLTR